MTTRKSPVRRKPATVTAKKKPAPKRELRSWEKILERSKRIPADELARHPDDGAANIDHYLYGVPKQEHASIGDAS